MGREKRVYIVEATIIFDNSALDNCWNERYGVTRLIILSSDHCMPFCPSTTIGYFQVFIYLHLPHCANQAMTL